MGELVLDVDQLKDPSLAESLQQEKIVEILREETTVLLGLSTTSIPLDRSGELIAPEQLHILAPYAFAEVIVKEALRLKVRGWKHAQLLACLCYIPLLQREAISLNHALTLLSEEYETERAAHTGNVFKQGFVELEDVWRPLQSIRDCYEGIDFEA